MTPQEKAKELVNKFNKIDSDSEMFDGFKMTLFYSQRCALIAVDEIMQHAENSYYNKDIINGAKLYWKEVKQEIEKI